MNTFEQNMSQAAKHLANAHKHLQRAKSATCKRQAKNEFARAKGLARAARMCKDRAKLGGYGFIGKVRQGRGR